MKKKMYTTKPLIENDELENKSNSSREYEDRIDRLEQRVRQLTEQVNRMGAALALNGRQIRRQNTDIHNVNTVLRNR